MSFQRKLTLLCLIAVLLPLSAGAQQLINPPAPLPTETEQRLAQVNSIADLERIAASFLAQGDTRRQAMALARMIQLRPQNAAYQFRLAQIYAARGEKTKTYDLLLRMQRAGLSYDPDQDPAFVPVNDTRAYEYIADALRENNKPFGSGKVAYELPAEDLLIESIAFDPAGQRFLVGSVREGAVYVVESDGSLSELVKADETNGMWGVFDIAVDARRNVLWIASTAVPHYKGYKSADAGAAGLFKFDLESNELTEAHLLDPQGGPHILSSLTVAPNGQVFVADGPRNAVYRLDQGELQPLFANIEGGSIRGMAVNEDGTGLYFADYDLGLFYVDLNGNRAFQVSAPEAVHTGGIDGLFAVEDGLVVIQNSVLPKRVMRLRLDDSGLKVAGAVPLVAAQAEMTLPTLGTVVGDELYFIANSQKGSYDSFGLLRGNIGLQPTRIYQTPLTVETPEVPIAPPAMERLRRAGAPSATPSQD